MRTYNRKYRKRPNHRANARVYERKRYARLKETNNAAHERRRIARRISNRIWESLRNSTVGKNGVSWEHLVGYTVAELRTHIERQFTKRMTWQNYGRAWELDHILPIASFDISGPDCPEFKACWALSNLRPLWKKTNTKKGSQRLHLL
jgi:hypothetical protein